MSCRSDVDYAFIFQPLVKFANFVHQFFVSNNWYQVIVVHWNAHHDNLNATNDPKK